MIYCPKLMNGYYMTITDARSGYHNLKLNKKLSYLITIVLPLVPTGNITLKYIGQLISSGLWDHSDNLFDLTLAYVHADGAECLLLAL